MNKTDIVNLSLLKINESSITDIDDTGDPIARKAKLLYEPTLREVLRAHFWGFAMTVTKCDPSELLAITINAEHLPGGKQKLIYAGISGGKMMFSTDGRLVSDLSTVFPWASVFWDPDELRWETHRAENSMGSVFKNWLSSEDVETPLDVVTWTEGTGSGAGGGALEVRLAWPDTLPAVYTGWKSGWKLPADFIKLHMPLTESAVEIDKFAVRRIGSASCIVTQELETLMLDYVQYVDDPAAYDPLFIQAFSTLLASRLARAVTGSEKMEADLLAAYHQLTLPDARTTDAQETQSGENHPLKEILSGSLTGTRGNWIDQD